MTESSLSRLLEIMARLRDPKTGCPWDIAQNFATIAPYTIEEAYEVADAIERGNMQDLRDELGDLLLQVVFHAHMASEEGLFTFEDVTRTLCEKMIRRHPHVFGESNAATAEEVSTRWEEIKATEKTAKGAGEDDSLLADIPRNLPALIRTQKIQKRAASVGFEWENAEGVVAKIEEELAELKEALASGAREKIADELGDMLSSTVNLIRFLKMDAESILRANHQKFERRFRHMEQRLKEQGIPLQQASLEQMEEGWQDAKLQEKKNPL